MKKIISKREYDTETSTLIEKRTCGVFGEPAGVAGTAGLKKAVETGLVPKNASYVSIVTGNGLKDVNNAIRAAGEPMSCRPDMEHLLKVFEERGIKL